MTLADWFIVGWCGVALFFGGLIKGALGVGTPLLTVPLMALVLPPQMAVVLMAVPVVVANVWQAFKAEQIRSAVSRFWPPFLTILIGTYFGVAILADIDDRSLFIVVGVIVISAAFFQGSSFKFHLTPASEKPAGFIFGAASGLIGGLSSLFGPMLIIYLLSIPHLGKERFVASISFLYIACVVPWAVMLVLFGVLDQRMALLSTLSVVPVMVGLVSGERLRKRMSDERFQRFILLILLISGFTMLWRAFSG